MAKPMEVTDATFDEEVLQSSKPVLVDFWAVWCGPCRMIAPILEEIAAEKVNSLKVVKLDVDKNRNTAITYGIRSIPTLLLFKQGKVVEQIIGALPKQTLLKKIEPHLE